MDYRYGSYTINSMGTSGETSAIGYRLAPILRLYSPIIGLVYCNPIPNLLNAAKWPFLFLLWPNGHSYSFCGLLAIPFLGYLSTIAFPNK